MRVWSSAPVRSISVEGASLDSAPPGTARARRYGDQDVAGAGCLGLVAARACWWWPESSALTLLVALPEGDVVVAGQEMCVVEAMKMQNVLRCPKDTTVMQVGTRVMVQGAVLCLLSSPPPASPACCPMPLNRPLRSARALCRLRRRLATICRWTRSSCCLSEGTAHRASCVAPGRQACGLVRGTIPRNRPGSQTMPECRFNNLTQHQGSWEESQLAVAWHQTCQCPWVEGHRPRELLC